MLCCVHNCTHRHTHKHTHMHTQPCRVALPRGHQAVQSGKQAYKRAHTHTHSLIHTHTQTHTCRVALPGDCQDAQNGKQAYKYAQTHTTHAYTNSYSLMQYSPARSLPSCTEWKAGTQTRAHTHTHTQTHTRTLKHTPAELPCQESAKLHREECRKGGSTCCVTCRSTRAPSWIHHSRSCMHTHTRTHAHTLRYTVAR